MYIMDNHKDKSTNFDAVFYKKIYPDVTTNPFIHYILYGKKEGRLKNIETLIDFVKKQNERINLESKEQIHNSESAIKINILIRTSNRPESFEKCIQSILLQEYDNYRIIICFDKGESVEYLNKYKNNKNIDIFPISIDSMEEYKFNLYCNHLMDKVTDGWIMFLDDDDILCHNNVLNNLVKHMSDNTDENYIYVWCFFRPDKIIYPKNVNNIQFGEIDSTSFCFNSKFKELARWSDKQFGDFRFFNTLINNNNKFNIQFIDRIFTRTSFEDKIGNFGN